MKRFIIEEDFWNLFPSAKVGIIICKDIDNTTKDEMKYQDILNSAQKEAIKYLDNDNFSENAVVKVWRDAFQQFKTKKGARSSIEALLKRVKNGNDIGTINPLVDIYNSISLKYALPCGGEDIDTFVGDVKLTKAIGNEDFITLGSEESAPPHEGEIVYKDDASAICRCWNWRESIRTMLTEQTRNAFLCIELVDESRLDTFNTALEDLKALVDENLGGKNTIHILDINNREIEIVK